VGRYVERGGAVGGYLEVRREIEGWSIEELGVRMKAAHQAMREAEQRWAAAGRPLDGKHEPGPHGEYHAALEVDGGLSNLHGILTERSAGLPDALDPGDTVAQAWKRLKAAGLLGLEVGGQFEDAITRAAMATARLRDWNEGWR
jgi:hypothetical protein